MNLIAPVIALLLSAAMLLMGNGLQQTLIPVRAGLEFFSTFGVGLLGSAYFVGFAVGCITGPELIRRVGHIRAYVAMTALASAVPLAHTLSVMPASWTSLRLVSGFCLAVLFLVIESWLNERATNETRGRILSIYLITTLLVITLGQMSVTLFDPAGFELFAISSILVSLAAVPIALTSAATPAEIVKVRFRLGVILRGSPVGAVGCFAIGMANGAFWALGPVFAAAIGLKVAGIALLMSAAVLGGALSQWPLGRFSDRVDRRIVIAGVSALAVLFAVLLARTDSSTGDRVLIMAACFGAATFPLYTLCAAHANDAAAPDEFVEFSSGLLLLWSAGAAIGPLVASPFMRELGPGGLYVFTAVVHAALLVFVLLRLQVRARTPEAERTTFAEALETSQTISPAFDVVATPEALDSDAVTIVEAADDYGVSSHDEPTKSE